MKRIILSSFSLILLLLNMTACSKNDNIGSTNQGVKRVIKASELFSVEDATKLVDQDMEIVDTVSRRFNDESSYESFEYTFSIALMQQALHDANSDYENDLLKDGWQNYIKDIEKGFTINYHSDNIVEVTGVKVNSYLQQGVGFDQWLLHIFYDDFYISLVIGSRPRSGREQDNAEQALFKQQLLKKAGELAVKRLSEKVK